MSPRPCTPQTLWVAALLHTVPNVRGGCQSPGNKGLAGTGGAWDRQY